MFHLARPNLRQLGYGYLIPWEETTKGINSLSTPQWTYPVSRKHSAATVQNYDIIACYPPLQVLYHCAVLMARPSKFGDIFVFGDKSLPVEALVLPHLGPDAMLDNSTMKAFGAELDWAAERRSFKDSNITIPATHTIQPIRSKYCSVITQDSDTEDIPAFVFNKNVVPAAREALIRVFSTTSPQKYVSADRTENCNRGDY